MKATDAEIDIEERLVQNFSSIKIKDNDEKEEEDKQIVSLEIESIKGKGENLEYVAKGPVFRSSQEIHKYAPYELSSCPSNEDPGIPPLPQPKGSQVNRNLMKSMMGYEDDGLLVFYEEVCTNVSEPCYTVVPYSFDIDFENQTIGFDIPRLEVPNHIQITENKCNLFIKIYPNSVRSISVEAEVERKFTEEKVLRFIKPQFIQMNPIKQMSGLMRIMSGVTKADIDSAVKIVDSKGEVELFKTYGPNNDTLLSMLCFSRDESASNRAKVLALTRKILSHSDMKYRSNLIFKNESEINALEFAATTNKPDIAAYIAELYYNVGEDVHCTDSEGNTLLHLLARKGDVVASSLKALLSLTLKNGDQMFLPSVSNKRGQTPMHIAARGSDSTKTLQILYEAFPDALTTKSVNGSLPLHMACQYSCDPAVIKNILNLNSNVVNEVRTDGYTPLHLLASRGNSNVPNVCSMDEASQMEAVKELISKGADCKKTVAHRFPCDLVDEQRIKVKLWLKLTYGYDGQKIVDNNNCINTNTGLDNMNPNHQNSLYSGNDPYFLGSNTNNNGGSNMNIYSNLPQTDSYDEIKAAQVNGPTSPTYSSGFESSPSSVQSFSPSKSSSAGTTPIHPGLSPSPTNTDPIYQFSPTNSNSNGVKTSEDEDEGEDLDAIAGYLYQHPTIQAAVNMAEKL